MADVSDYGYKIAPFQTKIPCVPVMLYKLARLYSQNTFQHFPFQSNIMKEHVYKSEIFVPDKNKRKFIFVAIPSIHIINNSKKFYDTMIVYGVNGGSIFFLIMKLNKYF